MVKVGDAVRVALGRDLVTGQVRNVYTVGPTTHVLVEVPVVGSSGEVLDSATITVHADEITVVDGEIIEGRDVTPAGMDGWMHRYVVRLTGDDEIPVLVWCSGTAVAMASSSPEIASVVHDRGRSEAVKAATLAQPGRNAEASVRCDSRGVSVSYEFRVAA